MRSSCTRISTTSASRSADLPRAGPSRRRQDGGRHHARRGRRLLPELAPSVATAGSTGSTGSPAVLGGGGVGSLVAPLPGARIVESSPDRVFRVTVKEGGVLHAQVSGDGWDPVLALRSSCLDTAREPEMACSAEANQEGKRVIEAAVTPGTYFLVVDGRGADSSGTFRLSYTLDKEAHEVESE